MTNIIEMCEVGLCLFVTSCIHTNTRIKIFWFTLSGQSDRFQFCVHHKTLSKLTSFISIAQATKGLKLTCRDLVPVDSHILVPVTPCMFMVEAESMEELMLNDTTIKTTVHRQRDYLLPSISADGCPAPVGRGRLVVNCTAHVDLFLETCKQSKNLFVNSPHAWEPLWQRHCKGCQFPTNRKTQADYWLCYLVSLYFTMVRCFHLVTITPAFDIIGSY